MTCEIRHVYLNIHETICTYLTTREIIHVCLTTREIINCYYVCIENYTD